MSEQKKQKVIIIGGGPAGLKAAEVLLEKFEVHLFEAQKTVGRKFLIAGKGGFNLTHDYPTDVLIKQYTPQDFLSSALTLFDVKKTREWLDEINVPTFVGSSGRVFPEAGIKPIQVLNNWKNKLIAHGLCIHLLTRFDSFKNNGQSILIDNGTELIEHSADYFIFSLGGASWPETGSNGQWTNAFNQIGIETNKFSASNCGLEINWPESILQYSGKPLKNIAINFNNTSIKGEVLICDYGIEGNAVYPISSSVNKVLETQKNCLIYIDLKPNQSEKQLFQKIVNIESSTKAYRNKLNLSSLEMALVKAQTKRAEFFDKKLLVKKLKSLPILIQKTRLLKEAISSSGGIPVSALNSNFSLKKYPHIFTVGEMVDWDAPTGGFLLQACFSMGFYAAQQILIKK